MNCSCSTRSETWEKEEGRWVCQADKCPHSCKGGGCKLGKISLTCDNNNCAWNKMVGPGIYACRSMDAHLDADGKCLGFKPQS